MPIPHRPLVPLWVHAAVVAIAVLAGYGADAGRAFIKEDANWIRQSRIDAPSDVARVFRQTGGFFRPIVALSFGVNFWMFGSHPLGYGWTNLLLALACAAAIVRFARVLGLETAAALLAASLWILSFHGINMAVLWLSGRTALLLVLFSTLAATAAVQDRIVTACVFAFLAMASKEEAVLLPVILLAAAWLRSAGPRHRKRLALFAIGLAAVWMVYGILRVRSDAYTPGNAPAFYTFAGPSWSLAKNILEYADRAFTLSVVVTLVVIAIARRRPHFEAGDANRIAVGAIWVVSGFALTMFLPTRSSLYVLFPSVGAVIIAATVVQAACRNVPARRQRALGVAALLVPLTFVPVYWQRNARWTELADVSRQTLALFAGLAQTAPPRWEVIIVDDPAARANVAAALGWGLTDAVQLVTGRRPRVWIAPPPPDMEPAEWVMAPAAADAVLMLRDRRVRQIPLTEWTPRTAGELE